MLNEVDLQARQAVEHNADDLTWALIPVGESLVIKGVTEREHRQEYKWPAPDRERIGGFIQTFTGRAVHPLDLHPNDIHIRDIAHHLSMQCRYSGAVSSFYSVAEHSVHVARWCRQYGADAALYGLLHDASEAYLVDVPRPIKSFLVGYKEAEERAMQVVLHRYGLPTIMHPTVEQADRRILTDERAALMAACEREWEDMLPALGVNIQGWTPSRAEREFLNLFEELYGED